MATILVMPSPQVDKAIDRIKQCQSRISWWHHQPGYHTSAQEHADEIVSIARMLWRNALDRTGGRE